MAGSSARGPDYLRNAKEYARFCRMRGLFLVDSVGLWRRELEARGLPEEVVGTKVSAAVHLVQSMADPF
jgi:hypothetical protein